MTAARHQRPDTWMPLYVGDYLRDTSRLTRDQHGGYLLLIMDYWVNGPPPDDDEQLAAIVKASPDEWKKLRTALERFFIVGAGVWRHKRIEREIEAAIVNIEQRRNAGRASGEARRQRKLNENVNESATETQRPLNDRSNSVPENGNENQTGVEREGQRNGNGMVNEMATEGSTKRQRKCRPSPSPVSSLRSETYTPLFEMFWSRYPSRGRQANPKKPARAKFIDAVERGVDPDLIIAAAGNYGEATRRDGTPGQYIKTAEVWLSKESWEQYAAPDEPEQLQAGLI